MVTEFWWIQNFKSLFFFLATSHQIQTSFYYFLPKAFILLPSLYVLIPQSRSHWGKNTFFQLNHGCVFTERQSNEHIHEQE